MQTLLILTLVFKTLFKGLIDDRIIRSIFCNIFQNSNKVLRYLNMLEFDTRYIFLRHNAFQIKNL